jgi:hypothetical protein
LQTGPETSRLFPVLWKYVNIGFVHRQLAMAIVENRAASYVIKAMHRCADTGKFAFGNNRDAWCVYDEAVVLVGVFHSAVLEVIRAEYEDQAFLLILRPRRSALHHFSPEMMKYIVVWST